MRREYMAMMLIMGGVVVSIILFVSKKNIRKAFFAATTAQEFTWPIGLLLTYLGKVEYPVRLFPKAIESSFLQGFIMNPLIFAIYYIHYPKQANLIWRCVYTLLISAIPVSIETIANKYTNLVNYKTWSGYYSWMLILIFYFIIRKYLDWFFKNVQKKGASRNEA